MAVEWLNIANEAELDEAVEVYMEGMRREIPPHGSAYQKDVLKKKLRSISCFVFKSNGWIAGLLTFSVKGFFWKYVVMDFICSMNQRKGIGVELMMALAAFAIQNNITKIYSSISVLDAAAMNFYFKKCGFKKTGSKTLHWPTDFEVAEIAVAPRELLQNLQRR